MRGALGSTRRGEDSHSRGCSKNHQKAPLVTQLVYWPLGKAAAQKHCLLQNILVSSAWTMWGTSPLPGCTQGTRQVEAGKSNLHPGRQELVATTAPPAIKLHQTSGPEMTGRETLRRGNLKEKGKWISLRFPQRQSWRSCYYEILLIPVAYIPLHCCLQKISPRLWWEGSDEHRRVCSSGFSAASSNVDFGR